LNVQGNRYGDSGVGSFDLHTNHEEVQIASESTGVRFAAIRPEDSQVTWAYELMNFPTTSFIRCYKDGVIEINSLDGNSSITVDGTSNKVTVDGTVNVELIASSEVTCTTPLTHVTGNMQIDGFCSHNGCTCDGQGGGVVAGGVEGGQTICGDILPDGELTLRGTTDETKGTVKVDANLACTDNCQLPSICGSDQPDGELDLAGTSDASKGCVNVNSDLKCSGSVCGSDQPDGELVLKGTKDVSKGCVKVDADLACTGGCQLPSVCGSDQVDGELTLSGTSDASKGCVTVDSDLECTGALGSTIKSSIKSYCDGLYSSSSSGVTNGDSHDHSGGDGAQIDHGGLNGLSDDDHSQYVKLAGRSGGQTIQGGTASGDDLILESTANATKGIVCIGPGNGKIYIGEDPYDATNAVAGWGFQRYTDGSLYTAWKTVTGGSINLRCGAGAETGYARTFLTITPSTGACYFLDNVSALSFTDRTPGYNGDALAEIKQITNNAQGNISHKTLPAFARATFTDQATGQQTEGRNIGNMVSILTKAVQQLTEKIETLENKINQLENP
jgi:phage baseplate assembly protein gpV